MWFFEGGFLREEHLQAAGIVHFVTTRRLGDMRSGPARRGGLLAAGIEPDALVTAEQVHGTAVAVIDGASSGFRLPATDGLFTAAAGIPLGITTADCMSVFIADPDRKKAALLHAGWRGLAGGILEAGMRLFDGKDGLSAAIGPHICPECYTVGPEVAAVFPRSCSGAHLDLEKEAVLRLGTCGISRERIAGNAGCTCHGKELFYSYRGGDRESRMLSVVML